MLIPLIPTDEQEKTAASAADFAAALAWEKTGSFLYWLYTWKEAFRKALKELDSR